MRRWLLVFPLSVVLGSLALAAPAQARAQAPKRYEPNWESVDSRPIPQWYKDAKFGVFIHWGVYSVPSWAPKGTYAEWYWNSMQDKNGGTWKFHERVYGKDFAYQDFAPMFRAELFNPDQWADVFQRSGAKYVVLTSKHHEGFTLWPNAQANKSWGRPWNAVDIGPKRDLLGDLTDAVRAKGLKMGIYYSLYEWYNPLYRTDFARFRDEHFFPQFKDVVTRYKPAVIFADGEWEHTSAEWHSPELLAWLYNEGGCGDDLVVDDRWGSETRGHHGGYYTTEYGGFTDFKVGAAHKWEESRGMGASYGYNRNETYDEYRTTPALVRLLVEMVSQGGNLLLDIGPTADGHIPVIMQDRLIGMGNWLKQNGEAIYGTSASPYGSRRFTWGTFTAKPGRLYAHVFARPGAALELPGLKNKVTAAYWLADPLRRPAATKTAASGVTVTMPDRLPDDNDSVLVLEVSGEPNIDMAVAQDRNGAIYLTAAAASIHGLSPQLEARTIRGNIGFWKDPKDTVSWDLRVTRPGTYGVDVRYSVEAGAGGEYTVTVAGQQLDGVADATGGWDKFATKRIGAVRLDKAGTYTLTLQPKAAPAWKMMNLESVTLRPAR